jgi:hypothetical protein
MKKMIEAGHFYECNGPSNVSMQGWQIGQARAEGDSEAAMALFIDDYHGEQAFVHEGEAFLGKREAEAVSAQADHVFYERDIATEAAGKLEELLDGSAVKVRKGVVSVAGVRLCEISDSDELNAPTCTFLDYVFLCKKTGIAPEQAVVLPGTYEKQQANLFKALEKLDLPNLADYTVILFEPDRESSIKEVSL